MFRPRVIPVLLIKDQGLVKSIKFRNYRYIGDPINAVKIYNDLGADELIILDILATKKNRTIPIDLIKRVGDEAHMPFSVGGGIRSIREIKQLIGAGAEKVVINTYAYENPEFIKEASSEFGSSTIVVSIDVRKNIFGQVRTSIYSGRKITRFDPVSFATEMEALGAGEIIINSIENDGMMNGYDINLIKSISERVRVPVVALGGAGNLDDLKNAVEEGYASAVAAGSMFIYHGSRNAVLINYPEKEKLNKLFKNVL